MNIAGVEEVVAIAVLQKLLGRERAKAKLVQMADGGGGVEWDQTFGGDPARQEWHARKMESKLFARRPADGTVGTDGGCGAPLLVCLFGFAMYEWLHYSTVC